MAKKEKIKKPSIRAKLDTGLVSHRNKVSGGRSLVKLPKMIEVPAFKTKIKIIGIGGGASLIISEIAQEIKKANFVVADTDRQVFKKVPGKAKRFRFGQSLTRGLGTGMDAEIGELAAQNEKEKIKELLEEIDLCILISCLGGGAGSGASPIFAQTSKKLKNITLGIFTLPFEFEGQRKMEIARTSLEKLKPNLNALIIIPNQRIFQIVNEKTSFQEAFSTINKFLANTLEGLIGMIYSSGLINISWPDLKATLEGKGKLTYLNTAEVKDPNQIQEALKRGLSNPLFPYSAQGASEILFNIEGGLNLNIGQVEQIGKVIASSINPQAKVAFGITLNKRKGIKITLLANGCKWENWEKEKPEKKSAELSKIQPTISQTLLEEKPETKIKEPTE